MIIMVIIMHSTSTSSSSRGSCTAYRKSGNICSEKDVSRLDGQQHPDQTLESYSMYSYIFIFRHHLMSLYELGGY